MEFPSTLDSMVTFFDFLDTEPPVRHNHMGDHSARTYHDHKARPPRGATGYPVAPVFYQPGAREAH